MSDEEDWDRRSIGRRGQPMAVSTIFRAFLAVPEKETVEKEEKTLSHNPGIEELRPLFRPTPVEKHLEEVKRILVKTRFRIDYGVEELPWRVTFRASPCTLVTNATAQEVIVYLVHLYQEEKKTINELAEIMALTRKDIISLLRSIDLLHNSENPTFPKGSIQVLV